MQVIVATDNPKVVEAVRSSLSGEDRQSVCESGLELLAAAGALAAEAVVIDLDMPGMNSGLLVSALHEVAPGVPIVAVTSRAGAETRPLLQKGVQCAIVGHGRLQPALAEVLTRPAAAASGRAR